MPSKGHTIAGLVEGHPRFCRGCGHDLIGLTGQRCPRCGRSFPALVYRPQRRRNGRWLVLGLLALGTALAAVGLKYRVVEPQPATGPATSPVAAPVHGPARRLPLTGMQNAE